MPYRFPWVTGVDRLLLEWLSDNDIVFSPSILHANLQRDLAEAEAPSYSQVSRRTRALHNVEFLQEWGDTQGKYVLTDLGRRFEAGELTEPERAELAEIDPDEVVSK